MKQCWVRWNAVGWIAIGLCLALLSGGCHPPSDESQGVELVTSSAEPNPAMNFELRFEQAMAKAGQIGMVTTNSPLVFTPPIPGRFTWLSARSGTFTPTEPLAMDTRYELRLRPDLKRADGQPAQVFLRKSLVTPAFALIGAVPEQASTNANSEPELKLLFNADVKALSAARFLEFVNAEGRHIPADVRQGTLDERPSRYELKRGSLRTWREIFADQVAGHPSRPARDADISEGFTNEVGNFIIVTPRQALPLGRDWRLVLNPGLPSVGQEWRLQHRRELMIGTVTPFTCLEITAHNQIHAQPTVQFLFSKPVAESLTNQPTTWIEVTPAPGQFTAQVLGCRLSLVGGFKSDVAYTFALRPGLPSAESFALPAPVSMSVSMPGVPPRLYFPAFSTDQMPGATRSLPLMLVNVPRVRLRAKLIDPVNAAQVLRGYGGYFRSWRERQANDSWDEPYKALHYPLVAGRTTFDQELEGATETDVPRTLDLAWNRLLGGQQSGVVFLEAQRAQNENDSQPTLGTQALIQLTDLGMLWKRSRDRVDVFVFSYASGQPVGGATARLLDDEGQLLGETLTPTNGLARLEAGTNGVWLTVRHGDDSHTLELKEHSIWPGIAGLPYQNPDAPAESRKVMLFSERALYQPGETLHLKALAREWNENGLSTPSAATATLTCLDARGREWLRTNVSFSAAGAWSASVPLPAGPLGDYLARLQWEGQEFIHLFAVQEYQPSAFEITLDAKPAFGPDEPIEVPVSARYYFGKALNRAQVKWSLDAEATDFSPVGFDKFTFRCDRPGPRRGGSSAAVALSGEGVLNSGRPFVIAPDLAVNPMAPQPRAVSLQVEVTDLNQQTLTRQTEFLRHSSEFYLGLRAGAESLTAGRELPLQVIAVRADGRPWPSPVKAQLALQRIEWQSVRLQGAGRSVRFHHEAILTNIVEKEIEILPARLPEQGGADVAGQALSGLIPEVAGQYWLELKAQDAAGHGVVCGLEFTVSAPGEATWSFRNEMQLTLKPDQALYEPGQSARILVEAPINGTALVTVEREKVLRSFLTNLSGNAPTITVPLEPGDIPNVFVSVALVRGANDCPRIMKEPDYRLGYCQLAVQDPGDHLAISVCPSATNYLPAQAVEVAVAVKDHLGQAAAGAEVTLYAVDEGILSLTEEKVPDPYAFFYEPRPLTVQTATSLPNLLPEDPAELRFVNKGYLGGGGGREHLRRLFLACAFWSAQLTADAAGQVVGHFTAPDSLTRYRVVAVAHANRRFGSGQSAFQVRKPLIVEPALPSFANISDRLLARALVQNQTAQAGEVVVTLELDNKARLSEPGGQLERRVAVSANGVAVVEFPVQFVEPGHTRWIWKARFADPAASDFTDAVQSSFAVGYVAPLLREIHLARLTQAATNLLTQANPQLLAGQGTVHVAVANTRLSELGEAVAQLLHYPYGCAEQTGSSLLPWILLGDSPYGLPLLRRGTNDAAAAIQAGINRFFSMQTAFGGLAYWPGEREPMLWASAYGGLVLALAQRHGVTLPGDDWQRLIDYLSRQLRSVSAGAAERVRPEEALTLFALAMAGHPEPAYQERLFSRRDQLSREDRALLALAILESHGSMEMVDDLLAKGADGHAESHDLFGCVAREQAVQLLAWARYQPENPLVDELVNRLMTGQKQAHWGTTQGDAWALFALTDYGQRVEKRLAPVEGLLSWQGQTLPFRLDERTNLLVFNLPLSNAAAPLVLTNPVPHPLYVTTTLEVRPEVALQPRQDHGFSLRRAYSRLDDENHPHGTNGWHVGDRVLVTLHLDVREPARFVAIDDALPPILEAIHPEFKTQAVRAWTETEEADDWAADFRELRRDRFLSFANEVAPGRYLLRYVARVRAAGTVTAPCAKVEEMYHPERYGLTEALTLSSEALP